MPDQSRGASYMRSYYRPGRTMSTGIVSGAGGGGMPPRPAAKPYNRELMGSPFQGSMPSNATDPRTKKRLSVEEATMRGPFYSAGWDTSGVGPGSPGYRGSWRPGGYNYGEGTRRPMDRTASDYYYRRDMEQGNPLDNLYWTGPKGYALMDSLANEANAMADGYSETEQLADVFGAGASEMSAAERALNPPALPDSVDLGTGGVYGAVGGPRTLASKYGSGSSYVPKEGEFVPKAKINWSDEYDKYFMPFAKGWHGIERSRDAGEKTGKAMTKAAESALASFRPWAGSLPMVVPPKPPDRITTSPRQDFENWSYRTVAPMAKALEPYEPAFGVIQNPLSPYQWSNMANKLWRNFNRPR